MNTGSIPLFPAEANADLAMRSPHDDAAASGDFPSFGAMLDARLAMRTPGAAGSHVPTTKDIGTIGPPSTSSRTKDDLLASLAPVVHDIDRRTASAPIDAIDSTMDPAVTAPVPAPSQSFHPATIMPKVTSPPEMTAPPPQVDIRRPAPSPAVAETIVAPALRSSLAARLGPVRAERFNESGLMGHAIAETVPEATIAAVTPYEASSVEAVPPAPLVGNPASPPAPTAKGTAPFAVRRGSRIAPVVTAIEPTNIRSAAATTPFVAVTHACQPAEPVTPRAAETGRSQRPAPSQAALAVNGAVSVAMHEVDQGVKLLIRLDTLNPEDRARLLREAGGLLARHGLVAHEMVVATPGTRTTHGRIS